MGKIWTICSGSGGVGKSTIALALAAGAAKEGRQVILLDASGISRSCDLVLGLESIVSLDMIDVVSQQVDIESALYPVPRYNGLRFACASLYNHVSGAEISSIALILLSLCDILVIDLPTGEKSLGNSIQRVGDERIIVARPDDASLRSTERLMLSSQSDGASNSIVLNRVSKLKSKRKLHHTQETVQAILDMPVIASIPEDESIPLGAQKGKAAIECDGPAWTVFRDLLKALLCASL